MAANKQTDIQTRLCNALPLVCGVLIQACLNDGLRMSSEWVGSQKPHQSHPKHQCFCLRREERRICFLSTQLPRSHPPPRPLHPSHIQLSSSFSYHPFSSSFSLSPTIFLYSLSLHLFKFILFLFFPRIPLLLPLSHPSRHVFVFSLCFLLVSSRRIPCLLSNSSPLQYVSFLPPSSPLLTYFFSHPLFYADHTPLHE